MSNNINIINSDIYNITENINNLKNRYFPEDEETLSLGIYGYITDLMSYTLKNDIMVLSELSNEVFPSKAKLDKNIITHAISYNIPNIFGKSSTMNILLGIKLDDFLKIQKDNKIILDKDIPIILSDESTITDYEFHLKYDIILYRSQINNKTDSPFYAMYNLESDEYKVRNNKININPYLRQPIIFTDNGESYIFIECEIEQVEIDVIEHNIIETKDIYNKSYIFEYTNNLVDFYVKVTDSDGNITYLTPLFEGAEVVLSNDKLYCYYTFIKGDTIRIKFDGSFVPKVNNKVEIIVRTTLGEAAIFKYTNNVTVPFLSNKYNYDIGLYLIPHGDSVGGENQKSIAELKRALPKETLSRGVITTEPDLLNYFNTINDSKSKVTLLESINNQTSHTYFMYIMLKDDNNNVVPTNTINLKVNKNSPGVSSYHNNDSKYIIKTGTEFYIKDDKVSASTGTDGYQEGVGFKYKTIHNIIIDKNPMHVAIYSVCFDIIEYMSYNYTNEKSPVQIIADKYRFYRDPGTDKYIFKMITAQNVSTDLGLVTLGSDGKTIESTKLKLYMVINNETDGKEKIYRYIEAKLKSYNKETFQCEWNIEFSTNDSFDQHNNIYINNDNLKVAGQDLSQYGYFNKNTKATIYILYQDDKYGLLDTSSIIPNTIINGYSLINKYDIPKGLTWYTDYTSIINSDISYSEGYYTIKGIPVIAHDYDTKYVIEKTDEKHAQILNSIEVLENSFDVNFKFYNTYGFTHKYFTDSSLTTSIGSVNLTMNFELFLIDKDDNYTENNIRQDIKDYIENFENDANIHIPNLMADIRDKYKEFIKYFEFRGYNKFDANIQHLYRKIDTDIADRNNPPEFLNIKTKKNVSGKLVPDINIEVLRP